MSNNIGENIRKARLASKMTQEDLANKMGYKSKSTINKIELGINDITQTRIVQFAKVLNTTPAELMGWVEATPEEIKESDIMADITSRAFRNSDYKNFLLLSNKLDESQILRATELLHLVFKETLDVTK